MIKIKISENVDHWVAKYWICNPLTIELQRGKRRSWWGTYDDGYLDTMYIPDRNLI